MRYDEIRLYFVMNFSDIIIGQIVGIFHQSRIPYGSKAMKYSNK